MYPDLPWEKDPNGSKKKLKITVNLFGGLISYAYLYSRLLNIQKHML